MFFVLGEYILEGPELSPNDVTAPTVALFVSFKYVTYTFHEVADLL